MSQPQIVSCPGCGKRYSVPPGAAPGQFQCQDCSAVVAYGQPAAAAGGRPQGAGSAKKAGRAAAARKKVHQRHAEEEDDDGRGRRHAGPPPKRHDAMPYVLGLVTLGIIVAGTAFLLIQTKKEAPPPGSASAKKGTGGGGAGPEDPGPGDGDGAAAEPAPGTAPRPGTAPSPAPAPAPSPAPAAGGGLRAEPRAAGGAKADDKFTPAENPPTGGNYGKSQGELLMMLKKGRGEVLVPLDHLPDTTPDLRTQIDADVARIADPDAGTEALKAAERLGKIGRAAIPRVLSVAAKLDFSGFTDIGAARDQGVVAQSVDDVLRRITGYEKIPALQYTPSANLADFQRNAEEWYVWWFATGYKRATFYKPAADEEEESL